MEEMTACSGADIANPLNIVGRATAQNGAKENAQGGGRNV